MSRRRLSDEEHALWKGVTRSILPLRKRAAVAADEDAVSPRARPQPKTAIKTPAKSVTPESAPVRPPNPAPPLALLGRRMKKRVARGSHAIDGRLDLHGMTQAEAHHALHGFLRRTQARGGSLVLVITGKGAGGDAHGGRGVLKRMVPLWLALPELRSIVIGYEAASVRHGGEGALYVRLRSLRQA